VDRIRSATFTVTRRGYDRREVDNYLTKLADWLEGGGADKVHAGSIREELERIGAKTTKVLTSAQDAADQIRSEAEREARQITADARTHVQSTRSTADDYAKKVRAEAEAISSKASGEAQAQARQIRDDAESHSARVRQEAAAYSTKIRDEADGYAKRVRSEADAESARQLKAAEAKAIGMVEEGSKRRREIEKVISDLQTRREAVVKGLEQLSSQLAGAATQSKSLDAKPASPAPTTQ
jgi:DivIVA domain-containing protein